MAIPLPDGDTPWRRLPWTLPGALLVLAAGLWGLPSVLGSAAPPADEALGIDAQVVELPAPPPPEAPAPRAKPLPASPAAHHPAPHLDAPPVAAPPPRQPTPPTPEALPAAGTLQTGTAAPSPPTGAPPAAATAATAPKGPTSAQGNGNGGSRSGAQALVHPLPAIPDDLRDDALEAEALARFHVAADGSARVELARPTQNPRLNRLLLDTLATWRFFPALEAGKPIASVEEIVIRLQVR